MRARKKLIFSVIREEAEWKSGGAKEWKGRKLAGQTRGEILRVPSAGGGNRRAALPFRAGCRAKARRYNTARVGGTMAVALPFRAACRAKARRYNSVRVCGGSALRGGLCGLDQYAVAVRGRELFAAWLRAVVFAHSHI
jgi:hypothetical protein